MAVIRYFLTILILFMLCQENSYGGSKTVLILKQDVAQYNMVLEGVKESINHRELEVTRKIVETDDTKQVQASVGEKHSYDLILSIGTKSSKIAVREFRNKPIIFAMVLNPVQEGIINSPGTKGRTITGVSARINPESYLEYAKKIQPKAKRIGIL